jgi:hypothetical protein
MTDATEPTVRYWRHDPTGSLLEAKHVGVGRFYASTGEMTPVHVLSDAELAETIAASDRWQHRWRMQVEATQDAHDTIAAVGALVEQWNEESGDLVPPLPDDAAWTLARDHVDALRQVLDGADTGHGST